MRTELQCFESNPYRRRAILAVTSGVDVEYDKRWDAMRVSWLVTGKFIYNGDHWIAPELVDDECMNDPEEIDELYHAIDKALLSRLFCLRRIERKLGVVNLNIQKG